MLSSCGYEKFAISEDRTLFFYLVWQILHCETLIKAPCKSSKNANNENVITAISDV